MNIYEATSKLETDIISVAGRVKNHARDYDAHLTPIGDALCNLYAMNLFEFYNFAKTLKNDSDRANLLVFIYSREDFCRKVIELNKKSKK